MQLCLEGRAGLEHWGAQGLAALWLPGILVFRKSLAQILLKANNVCLRNSIVIIIFFFEQAV